MSPVCFSSREKMAGIKRVNANIEKGYTINSFFEARIFGVSMENILPSSFHINPAKSSLPASTSSFDRNLTPALRD